MTPTENLTCPRCAGPLKRLANGRLHCDYCGWEGPLPAPPPDAAVRMETAVTLPFLISKAEAAQKLGDWLGKGWFKPSDLQTRAVLQQIRAIHLPAVRVVVDAESSWSGYDTETEYETVTETETDEDGEEHTVTRQEPHEVRYPKSGTHTGRYTYWLPLAGAASQKDLAALAPWKTEMGDQRPAAEPDEVLKPQWTFEELEPEIHRLAEADERSECAQFVDVLQHVSTTAKVVEKRFYFLPLWSLSYRYGDKLYPALVNGQTGAVTGSKPVSWKKVIGLVIGVAAAVGLLILLIKLLGH